MSAALLTMIEEKDREIERLREALRGAATYILFCDSSYSPGVKEEELARIRPFFAAITPLTDEAA